MPLLGYVILTSSAFCMLVSLSFSSSAENDTAYSFSFRFREKISFHYSVLVSFSAENAKAGFGRSIDKWNVREFRSSCV